MANGRDIGEGEEMNGEDIVRLSLRGERTMKQRIEWAVNMEREACAKIVEEPWQGHFREVAAQIRARGQV